VDQLRLRLVTVARCAQYNITDASPCAMHRLPLKPTPCPCNPPTLAVHWYLRQTAVLPVYCKPDVQWFCRRRPCDMLPPDALIYYCQSPNAVCLIHRQPSDNVLHALRSACTAVDASERQYKASQNGRCVCSACQSRQTACVTRLATHAVCRNDLAMSSHRRRRCRRQMLCSHRRWALG
jgi:hypothetical protein